MEENIASIIRHGETSRVQFKLNFTSQKEIAREISGLLKISVDKVQVNIVR